MPQQKGLSIIRFKDRSFEHDLDASSFALDLSKMSLEEKILQGVYKAKLD